MWASRWRGRAGRGSARRRRRRRRRRAGSTGGRAAVPRGGRAGHGSREGGPAGAVGQPLGLFQEAGPEEVADVAAEAVRAGQPALVVPEAVGVEAQQQVPGGVGALGEPGSASVRSARRRAVAPPTGSLGCGPATTRTCRLPWPTDSSSSGVPPREVPTRRRRARAGWRAARAAARAPGRPRSDSAGGRQGTPPRCGVAGTPAVRGVRTVSHEFGGSSTPRGQRDMSRHQPQRPVKLRPTPPADPAPVRSGPVQGGPSHGRSGPGRAFSRQVWSRAGLLTIGPVQGGPLSPPRAGTSSGRTRSGRPRGRRPRRSHGARSRSCRWSSPGPAGPTGRPAGSARRAPGRPSRG